MIIILQLYVQLFKLLLKNQLFCFLVFSFFQHILVFLCVYVFLAYP